jgi:hypothetical protein
MWIMEFGTVLFRAVAHNTSVVEGEIGRGATFRLDFGTRSHPFRWGLVNANRHTLCHWRITPFSATFQGMCITEHMLT